ncbi:sensor histidine kinase [Ekhidna sp.]|uniref:sensor histidine kinase n=1 Tax=Ekhidna sp. TaxID=2608089 RepID=UPI003B51243E
MNPFKIFISKKWVQHLAFWVLSFYFIGSYFSISGFLKFIDFIYSGFFHIPLVLLVYINIRYLIPKFLQKENYFPFILLSIFNIGLAYFIHELLFEIIIPTIPEEFVGVFYIVSFTDIQVLIAIFGSYVVITTLLKLSKSWYELQQLEKERLSLELNSLKMQINPHFLFNSLNSMYSLARKKSEKAPDAILRLSNLMRYMIYEVSEEVPLSKEIDAIQDYLDLQKLRLEEDANITFAVEGETEHQMIAPLLFFPIIENSFKHGLKGDKGTNFVSIMIKNTHTELTFHVTNNKGTTDHSEEGKYGGIGLANVKKRLHLIYGDLAHMEVKDANDSFDVLIKIKWND